MEYLDSRFQQTQELAELKQGEVVNELYPHSLAYEDNAIKKNLFNN